MTIPAVEGEPKVGTVRRIVLRRQANRRAEFFYFAWGARHGVPFDAVDDLRLYL